MQQFTAPQPRYCHNCHYPLAELGEYCSHCGQRYTKGRISFGQLVAEFLETVLNFDSKIFRTLGTLLVPGKLTREYFKGRHNRYIRPLRLFLVMTLVLLAVVSFEATDDLNDFFRKQRKEREQALYQSIFLDKLDSAKLVVRRRFPGTEAALDSLSGQFRDTRQDSVFLGLFWTDNLKGIFAKDIAIPAKDLETKPVEELATRYGFHHWLDRMAFRQAVKLNVDTSSFTQFVLGKLSWMILLMMPALALLLKLLYIRRQQYYVEHLIFSFHYHAFGFLIASIALLISNQTLVGFAFLLVLGYLYMAMRRVYGQGWAKTFLKFNLLNFAYLIIFTLFASLTFIVSAALF